MSWKLTFLVAIAIAAVAGVAVAATGGSKNVTLCAAKNDGALSLASNERCARGETKLTIAKQGPRGTAGQPGSPGATGATGPAGTTASVQPEAVRLLVAASPSGSACEGQPGSFCYTNLGTYEWTNAGGGTAPTGFQKDAAGFVHLQGSTTVVGSGGGDQPESIFFLPSGYRPLDGDRSFAVPLCDGETLTSIRVETSGAVQAEDSFPTECLSLDGIAFHP